MWINCEGFLAITGRMACVLMLCVLPATGGELPPRDLEAVVALYLSHTSDLRLITLEYSIEGKDIASGRPGDERGGTFALDADLLAVKTDGVHAVFGDRMTKYRSLQSSFGTLSARPAADFGEWRWNPAILFDVMQDTEYTRISKVLSDAIGPRQFGDAELVAGDHHIHGVPCYLIQGKYDRVKLNDLDRPQAIWWKYRLFLDPKRGMQVVRKETFNVAENIPLGVLEVTQMREIDDSWVPTEAALTSYRYQRKESGLHAEPSIETTYRVREQSITINGKRDAALFEVELSDGVISPAKLR